MSVLHSVKVLLKSVILVGHRHKNYTEISSDQMIIYGYMTYMVEIICTLNESLRMINPLLSCGTCSITSRAFTEVKEVTGKINSLRRYINGQESALSDMTSCLYLLPRYQLKVQTDNGYLNPVSKTAKHENREHAMQLLLSAVLNVKGSRIVDSYSFLKLSSLRLKGSRLTAVQKLYLILNGLFI